MRYMKKDKDVEGSKSVNMNLVLHVVAGLSVKFHCEYKPLLFCIIGEVVYL